MVKGKASLAMKSDLSKAQKLLGKWSLLVKWFEFNKFLIKA